MQLRDTQDQERLGQITQQLQDELNVKEVRLASDSDSLLDHRVRPNLPILGPKYGKRLADVRKLLADADADDIAQKVDAGELINLNGVTLEPAEVLVDTVAADGYAVESDGQCSVGVSTKIDNELLAEGMVRETAHIVQLMRKNSGLEISDRIVLWLNAEDSSSLAEALISGADYIASETLAVSVSHDQPAIDAASEEHRINGENLTIALRAC